MVTMLRVIAASLVLRSFLAPGFFLRPRGALCSLLVLALTRILPPRWFGPVQSEHSCRVAHVVGQLALAYVWLVPHAAVWYLCRHLPLPPGCLAE